MSEVRTFFRFCPACGRRFHIRLVSKKLLADRRQESEIVQNVGRIGASVGFSGAAAMPQPIIVEERVPLTVEVEDFQYAYKCKHCGHVWTEVHEEKENV